MSESISSDRAEGAALRERLRHVYWLGGGSGAGKSTLARRLAAERGLRVYATDDVMAEHARRITAEDAPLLHRFMAMDMDERWVHRTPRAMLETFPWFRGEGFALIVEDLLRLPQEPRILVEGFRLLPRLVAPLLADPAQAVWLLPTPKFRQTVFEGRGGPAWGFLGKTSDPPRALRRLLARDALFTEALRAETARLGVRALEVDVATGEEELAGHLTRAFGL